MESKMQIFDSAQFGRIRTFDVKGNPWFVGRDVAVALGYKETAKAVREKVDIEDKGVSEIDTPGGKQQITIINESGLYSLIMSSKLAVFPSVCVPELPQDAGAQRHGQRPRC